MNTILPIIDKIKGSGEFCSSGKKDFIASGLKVDEVGELSFPLLESQIKELIHFAKKAPFGKGSETVLDVSVRNTWEIDASKAAFGNPKWQKFIQKILQKSKSDLGLKSYEVVANLYKLLIYEKGGFFVKHKDSEKEEGMFGMLVIGLSAKHKGGELAINFENNEQTIDFSKDVESYKIPYVAFYADCEHEVKVVTEGYRVCLVYNLVQKKPGNLPKATQLLSVVSKISTVLKNNEDVITSPKAILLGHQYTPANFSLESLKLNDRPKAVALLKAAEDMGYYAFLGLVTSYVAGELITEYDYDRNYYDDNDSLSDGEMGEIFDSSIEISGSKKDKAPSVNGLYINEKDIIRDFELNDGEPIEKETEGFTGNAGMEMMYWYHYGAVFLWPKKKHFEILEKARLEVQLRWLRYYVENWNTIEGIEKEIAKEIAETPKEGEGYYESSVDFESFADYYILQNQIGELSFEKKKILMKYFAFFSTKKWITLLEVYPIINFIEIFKEVATEKDIEKTSSLLEVLVAMQKQDNENWEEFIFEQTKLIPVYLEGLAITKRTNKKFASLILKNTLKLSVLQNENVAWVTSLVKIFTDVVSRDYINTILTVEILKSKRNSLSVSLKEFCELYLQDRVANKPEEPKDWIRSVPEKISRYDEKIWEILTEFICSPVQKEFLYKQVQAKRLRMEEAIRRVTVDLVMTTVKKGSPHTLVLTKTNGSYRRAYRKWEEDKELMRRLEKW